MPVGAAALIGASALDHAEAVIEHGIMECSVVLGEISKGAP